MSDKQGRKKVACEARRSTCCPDRKIIYTSRKDALHYAAMSSIKLSPYKCPSCKEWHLTSKPSVEKVDKHKQLIYRGCVLTLDDALWTCPSIPDRYYGDIGSLKLAVREHLHQLELKK